MALLNSPSMVVRDRNGVRRYIGWAAVFWASRVVRPVLGGPDTHPPIEKRAINSIRKI